MKRIIVLIVLSVASITMNARAVWHYPRPQHYPSNRLAHTRWEGTLKLETPTDAILDFSKDTLIVFKAADHSRIETMTYSVTDSLFTIVKTSGQSDCDNKMPGVYKFLIKGNGLDLMMVTDKCDDRSTVLTDTHWIKTQ